MIDKEEKYDLWFPIKRRLNRRPYARPFKEGQIWWCSIGVNIGSEIFGKGHTFTRPVLIIKKYGALTFLGAPITTTLTEYKNHIRIDLQGQRRSVLLDQLRTLDARRMDGFMETLSKQKFREVKTALRAEF